jgi:hypothetical protein
MSSSRWLPHSSNARDGEKPQERLNWVDDPPDWVDDPPEPSSQSGWPSSPLPSFWPLLPLSPQPSGLRSFSTYALSFLLLCVLLSFRPHQRGPVTLQCAVDERLLRGAVGLNSTILGLLQTLESGRTQTVVGLNVRY